jgi:hypothetical protein
VPGSPGSSEAGVADRTRSDPLCCRADLCPVWRRDQDL